jgi:hypothetical protein
MRKNSRLKVPVTVSLDYEYLKEFEQHSKGKLSETINAVLREEYEKQKNEQPQCDPLGLKFAVPKDKVSRQSSLFETFVTRDKRDEISKFVNQIPDIDKLNLLVANAQCMLSVSKTRRDKIRVR